MSTSPPRKRQRVNSPPSPMEKSPVLLPVLHENYYKPVDMMEVYVTELKDKMSIAPILKVLQKYDTERTSHLGRVKKTRDNTGGIWAILCEVGREDILQVIVEECKKIKVLPKQKKKNGVEASVKLLSTTEDVSIEPVSLQIEFTPEIRKVPSRLPLTPEQLKACNAVWPTSIKVVKVVDPLDVSFFTTHQLEMLEQHMFYAVSEAKKITESTSGNAPIYSLCIDPSTMNIVAQGGDASVEHPLHHSVMNAIHNRAASCRTVPSVENSASDSTDYLCTGLWLVTTREPCPMCAMAAVHSRFACVIYGSEDHAVGALGSRFQLHLESQLNHHFVVFKHLLRSMCQSLWPASHGMTEESLQNTPLDVQ